METTINGKVFSFDRLNAFEQFYIFKRLAPMLPAYAALMKIVEDRRKSGTELAESDLFDLAYPFVHAFYKMPDDDIAFVCETVLSKVKYHRDGGKFPVMQDGQLMYQDMEPDEIGLLVYHAIREKIVGFIERTATNLAVIWGGQTA